MFANEILLFLEFKLVKETHQRIFGHVLMTSTNHDSKSSGLISSIAKSDYLSETAQRKIGYPSVIPFPSFSSFLSSDPFLSNDLCQNSGGKTKDFCSEEAASTSSTWY